MSQEIRDANQSPPRKKRPRKRRLIFCGASAGLLLLIVFLPRMLATPAVISGSLNQFGGLAPLRLELSAVEAGWFEPISASGIQVLDADGVVLAQVGHVGTEKGIIGWLWDSSDLGRIVVERLEVEVVTEQGTTNLEKTLQPILASWESDSAVSAEEATTTETCGTIEVVDSNLLLRRVGHPDRWRVDIPKLSLAMPAKGQLIGPIEANLKISEIAGSTPFPPGVIAVRAEQAANENTEPEAEAIPPLELRAKLENVPLGFWHVLHERLPDIPVQALGGTVSAILAGNIASDSAWMFQFRDLNGRQLSVTAPDLLGPEPARMDTLTGAASCYLADSRLKIENAAVACDFASAEAKGSIPWPLVLPTATDPFVSNASLEAAGEIDLPKLAQAAKSLIPLREGIDLRHGILRFEVRQLLDAAAQPTSRIRLELDGLAANAGGQALVWDDALLVDLGASRTAGRPRIDGVIEADFAALQAQGTIQAGKISGDVDFSQLRRRLGQWVELPISDMSGRANLVADWSLESEKVVSATGSLQSTPVSIGITNGKHLRESAWDGQFAAKIGLRGGVPDSIQSASLRLQSQEERFLIDLLQPLSLNMEKAADVQPAAFKIDVHADLARCLQRGNAWLDEPAQLDVNGKLQLAASGLIDLNHIELQAANWNGQPIQVVTPQLSFAEPRIVGNFKGRVDSSDLTRTAIESLELTSSSVSLIAQDFANPQRAEQRTGRARFIVDLGRLLKHANTGSSSLISAASVPPQTTSSSTILGQGRCEGELAWQIAPDSAGVSLQMNGADVAILSASKDQSSSQVLWQEPNLTAAIEGQWLSANNTVELTNMTFQTPWLNFAGRLNYQSQEETQQMEAVGQVAYDCQQLSNKLLPFTGGELQLAGQHTAPVKVRWSSGNDPNASFLAGLNATTSAGWEGAELIGIQVGKADVPIAIENGRLASAAELAVNGGIVRWDLTSDLTADTLVLEQKPMTVLDNVEITQRMCNDWLKYINPWMAGATSVDGRLSLMLDHARLQPADLVSQSVAGQMIVHNATVGPGPFSNQLIAVVRQVDALRKQQLAQPVSGTQRVWMNMPEQRIDFRMSNGRISHENLSIRIGDATIATQGGVYVDGRLELMAIMPIPDDWADKSPYLAGLKGQSLNFPIDGSLSNPSVDTRKFGELGSKTAQSAAFGLLNQGINRGLEKLLGNPGGQNAAAADTQQQSNQLQSSPQQGIQDQPQQFPAESPENAILGLGNQILKGQGIKLPGIFGNQPNNSQPPAAQDGSQ